MKYLKKIFLIIFLIGVFLQSCVISTSSSRVISTSPVYSGYSKLSANEKERVVFTDTASSIADLKDDGKIYAITGTQLHRQLCLSEIALVYFWSPGCRSDDCLSLPAIEKMSKDYNIDLYIIAQDYDFLILNLQKTNPFSRPIFSINEIHYKTSLCHKYEKKFKQDLFGDTINTIPKELSYSSYFFFNKGELLQPTHYVNDSIMQNVVMTNRP